jgi:hypothetical protein
MPSAPGTPESTQWSPAPISVVGSRAPVGSAGVGSFRAAGPVQPSYTVTFGQSELNPGTTWWVNVTSPTFLSTSSTSVSLSFSEPNGTYEYSVASADKTWAPVNATGSFSVNGGAAGVTVTFYNVKFLVTFTETGLSPGIVWNVSVSNGVKNFSNTSTLFVREPNGSSYSYTVGTPDLAYVPAQRTGPLVVAGGPVTVPTVEFHEVLFLVNFTEQGLHKGQNWSVNFTSAPSNVTAPVNGTQSAPYYDVLLANGTYNYTASASNPAYSWETTNDSLTVDGAALKVDVTFDQVNYKVLFIESGLPTNTSWAVSFSHPNHLSRNTTGGSIAFYWPNGTHYNYNITTTLKLYEPFNASGSFNISGSALNVSVPFHLLTFKLTFRETGLPLGANWTLTLGGVSNWSVTPTMIFVEPNGTYPATLAPIATYIATPSSWTISVAGKPLLQVITFSLDTPQFRVSYLLGGIAIAVLIGAVAVLLVGRQKKPPRKVIVPATVSAERAPRSQ